MTSDGDALFRAICDQPQEDTPRLVYADWLEENGQPERAEYIRLQCEAWQLCSAYSTLSAARTRASELLKQHGDRWYNELPVVPGLEWGDLFVRGFIDSAHTLEMDDVNATLTAAFAAAPLRHLTITRLHRGQLRELLQFPLLSRLAKLNLPGILGRDEARQMNEARVRFPHTDIE